MLYIYLSALNTDEEKNYFEEIWLFRHDGGLKLA